MSKVHPVSAASATGVPSPASHTRSTAATSAAGQAYKVKEVQTSKNAHSPLSKHTAEEEETRTNCQRVTRGLLSLRFLLLALLTVSLLTVSMLSWQLTLRAAEDSLSLVTHDYSSVLVGQISSDFQRRLTAAEHIVAQNRALFRSGALSFTNGRAAMMELFRSQVRELVSDTLSSMSMTTKNGELNGYG